MLKKNTAERTNDNRPPVSYLVALHDKLQHNANKVENNNIETQQNLNRDIRKMNEGRRPLHQEDINKTILVSLEMLNTLDKDSAEASRLQHPYSEMIEKDVKQLRKRVMKLREEHDRIYNCSTFNRGQKTGEKLDDSEWEVQTPSEVKTNANTKYSISSSPGPHECSETGFRWRSGNDVSLEYQFVEWKSLSKDIIKNYKPCGPLMDISVNSGTLEEIQLPHFVCADPASFSDDTVEVLHVKDGTVSLEKCELSGFHAKIVNPTFSLLAIVVKMQQYIKMKFYCETLIYYNIKAPRNFHVYLILKDKTLKKDVEKKEKKNMEIVKPIPDEALKIDDCYTLETSCGSKIKPTSLNLTPGKANFFDLHLQDEKEHLELSIKTKDGQKIWDVNIDTDEFNTSASEWRHTTSDGNNSMSVRGLPLIMQWWRQLLKALEQSARTHFETSLLSSGSDPMQLRSSLTLQGRISGRKGHQSGDTDTAQKKEGCKKVEGAKFVEKHSAELIRRVSLVDPIADEMRSLIGDEKYQTIIQLETTQAQMRKLVGHLTTNALKEKLYQILVTKEYFLVKELELSG